MIRLGEDLEIEELAINWPGGARQVLKKLKVNRIYTITEPEGDFSSGLAQTSP